MVDEGGDDIVLKQALAFIPQHYPPSSLSHQKWIRLVNQEDLEN